MIYINNSSGFRLNIFLGLILLLSFDHYAQSSNNEAAFFKNANHFFEQNVANGLVKYKAIKASPKALNALVKQIANFDLKSKSKQEIKAFYINAYNILTINEIVKNYPIRSPKAIPGLWDKKKHSVSGQSLTLNDIENVKLRKQYKDPRLHFVLVCAAKGCPEIVNFAYISSKLELQLTRQTRKNINNPRFIRINDKTKVVSISEIFQWYKDDFASNNDTYKDYITRFSLMNIEGYTFNFYKYDWTLNDHK